MALRGMLLYFADFSSCAKVIPPAAFTATLPRVPSEAVPERMTLMARSPRSLASEFKKWSMGMC